MSQFNSITIATEPTAAELAEWQDQLSKVAPDTPKAAPTATVATRSEIVLDGNG